MNRKLLLKIFCCFTVFIFMARGTYAQYCSSAFSNVNYEYISNVTFGGINNTTGGISGGPVDYTGMVASVGQGISYSISVTIQADMEEYVFAFIDWNHNNVLDDAGEVYTLAANTASNGPFSLNIAVPMTADTGNTRLRVMLAYSNDMPDPCLSQTYGEAEDYTVHVAAASPCSGTPVLGVVSAPSSVCSGSSFVLSLSGYTPAAGITYQWQAATTAPASWTNVGTASADPALSTSITVPNAFRCIATCANSNISDTVTGSQIALNPFLYCYCTPNQGGAYYGDFGLGGFVSSGAIVNVADTNDIYDDGYADYTGNTAYITQMQGLPVTLHIPINTYYWWDAGQVSVWIDYDHDGSFNNTSEQVYVNSNVASNAAGIDVTFTVPATADTGLTRMRIRSEYLYANLSDACTSTEVGETEDYLFRVVAAVTCSGTPTIGSLTGPASVCAGADFNLHVNGTPFTTGLQYLWQQSTNPVTTWTTLGSSASYDTTANITAPAAFRCIVACANSGQSDTSNTILVGLNGFFNCYCTPTAMYNYGDYGLSGFSTTAGVTNASEANSDYGGYTDYTSDSPYISQMKGLFFNMTIPISAAYWYGDGNLKVYADWNRDGVFNETDEVIYNAVVPEGATSVTTPVTVPLTADTGFTRIRVRSDAAYSAIDDACTSTYVGETEDYRMRILTPVACSGTPDAGSVVAADSICNGVVFDLNLTVTPSDTGITYQWQSSPAGSNSWANVGSAAVNPLLSTAISSATDFRCIAHCSGSGLSDTTDVHAITIKSISNCYCEPAYSNDCSSDDYIDSFSTSGGITNITNNASGCNAQLNNYISYADTVSAVVGDTVHYHVAFSYEWLEGHAVWVDWNHDGDFDDADELVVAADPANAYDGSFSVPATALTGTTRLRIRAVYYQYTADGFDPCQEYSFGETEDYAFTVLPCPLTSVHLGADTTICSGQTITLHPDITDTNYHYLWTGGSSDTSLAVTDEGIYSVTVSRNASCAVSDTVVVSAGTVANADIVKEQNGATIHLSLTNVQGTINTISWSFGDNTASVYGDTASHTYIANGTYVVTVTIQGPCGTFQDTANVVVTGLGIGNAHAVEKAVSIYPSPAQHYAVIESENLVMKTIAVYNHLGQLIEKHFVNGRKYRLEINKNYASGIYTVRIETNEGTGNKKMEILR